MATRKILSLLLFFFLLALLVLSGSLVIVVINFYGGRSVGRSDKIIHGKYYQIDPITFDSESGFADFYESMIDEELGYLTYVNDGENVLISGFDKKDHICFGTCECVDNRRSSNVLFSRSIIYLAATVGSLLAYNIAEEYFEEQCVVEVEESCGRNSIVSRIEHCQSVSEFEETKEHSEEEEEEESTPSKPSYRNFQCRGECMYHQTQEDELQDSEFLMKVEEERVKMGKSLPCGVFDMNEVLELDENGEFEYIFLSTSDKEEIKVRVERFFKMNKLHHFCTTRSMREFLVFSKQHGEHLLHEASVCVGYHLTVLSPEQYENPSVRCIEV